VLRVIPDARGGAGGSVNLYDVGSTTIGTKLGLTLSLSNITNQKYTEAKVRCSNIEPVELDEVRNCKQKQDQNESTLFKYRSC